MFADVIGLIQSIVKSTLTIKHCVCGLSRYRIKYWVTKQISEIFFCFIVIKLG